MATTNTVFKMTFPDKGWKETTTFTFEGPYDNGVQHNLVVVIDPEVNEKVTLKTYAQMQMEGPKNALPAYELDRERHITLPNGLPAYEVIYHYVPAEKIVLFQKHLYLMVGGKVFIFTATYSKKTFETIGPIVDRIINSFTLINPDRIA